ncbi:MAG: rod shape-determining protein [Clostridiales Family XIII bacterium]|jgi:rod shape-determining protein MreB|nr:rod shape-determining protein [Clostridiales Family XIII bacterium]
MLFNKDIGIDLGTANTLIYIKGKGIVINQPSVIAVDTGLRKILAVGRDAKNMIGKAPEHIRVIRPLQDGVISDFEMTASMLRVFLKGILDGAGFFTRIRIVVGVPSGVTEVEKRAVEEVIRQMGARDVYILDEPMAAAIGCGLPVDDPTGCMIADIGGGTSDIAIIALGGIVTSTSLRHAGDRLNEAIVVYMRKSYDLLIGDRTAEELKIGIGCAYFDVGDEGSLLYMDAKGRDIISGLPKTIRVSSREIFEALEEPIGVIIDGIRNTLEHTPPELAADIVSYGMVLTGGGGLIRGLDRLITKQTGLQVFIAENALEAVAEGTGKSLKSIGKLERYASKKLRR